MPENNKPTSPDPSVERIMRMLEEGKSHADIRAVLMEELAAEEPIGAGIIRTRKGALMVRVSDDRWPIAMYKKDWKILLSKVPAIRKALETMNIVEENPEPARGGGQEAA